MIAIPENIKGKAAAQKAVNTFRYRQIEDANFLYLLQLHEEIQEAERNFEYAYDRDSYIAKNIGKTTWKSFCRYGDRNQSTPGLILYWIKKDGIPLDEQAMFMSEDYGHIIEPWELANFIAEFDCGCHLFEPIAKVISLKQTFKETAGFNYNFHWINKHLVDAAKEPKEDLPF